MAEDAAIYSDIDMKTDGDAYLHRDGTPYPVQPRTDLSAHALLSGGSACPGRAARAGSLER